MKNLFIIKHYHIDGFVEYDHLNFIPGLYSFSFLMEGEALVEAEGKSYYMNPGQLLLQQFLRGKTMQISLILI